MKNKKVIISSIIIVSVLLLFFCVTNVMKSSKSNNIKLETNYEDIIYVSDKAKFLMVVKKDKVSNLLFLNKEASKSLANKKIEEKNVSEATELIIDHLKNDNLLNDTNNMEVKSLKQSSSYQKITSSFNKNLVVYGIRKEMVNGSFTLDVVMEECNMKEKTTELDNIEELYNYSKKIVE